MKTLITLTLAVALLAAPGCATNPADRVLAEADRRLWDNGVRGHAEAAIEYRAGNSAMLDAMPLLTPDEADHLRKQYLDELERNIDLRRGAGP